MSCAQMGTAGQLCHLSLGKGACYYVNYSVVALLGARNRHTWLLGTATNILWLLWLCDFFFLSNVGFDLKCEQATKLRAVASILGRAVFWLTVPVTFVMSTALRSTLKCNRNGSRGSSTPWTRSSLPFLSSTPWTHSSLPFLSSSHYSPLWTGPGDLFPGGGIGRGSG